MSPPVDTGAVHPLVEFIVNNEGLAESLIRDHFDDGDGYCRACALGAQRGYLRFPCDIRQFAEEAQRAGGQDGREATTEHVSDVQRDGQRSEAGPSSA